MNPQKELLWSLRVRCSGFTPRGFRVRDVGGGGSKCRAKVRPKSVLPSPLKGSWSKYQSSRVLGAF